MVFRRGKKDAADLEAVDAQDLDPDVEPAADFDDAEDVATDDLAEAGAGVGGLGDVGGSLVSPILAAHERPWDVTEAPAEGPPRLDLGALLVPVLPDTEIRVELNEQRMPIAATILHAGSALQVLAFAAPRRDGIWDDVRAEIAESITADGGHVEEFASDLGIELRATVRADAGPAATAEQTAAQPLRFVGFDGPRWFVRGVYSGPAALGEVAAAVLDSAMRDLVVVRGDEAMAPRDPLALRLPRDAVAAQEDAEAEGATAPTLDPLTRGPEITETR